MESKKALVVVDIPEGTSAEDVERLLNAPIEQGYYLDKLYGGGGLTVGRAIFKVRLKDKKAEG